MINMDMIGRVQDHKLYIGGVGTGSTFKPAVEKISSKYNFEISYSIGGYASSDHTSFVAHKIPVLFFFSGLHSDYHKPSDEVKPDWDLSGAVDDTRALFEVGLRVLNGDHWPEWKPGTEFKARRDSMLSVGR